MIKKKRFIHNWWKLYLRIIHSLCEFLCITYIDKKYDGDAFFPEIDWKKMEIS